MEQKEFNLIDEEWICVLWKDGAAGAVSIKEALLNAHTIVDLAGEMRTQDLTTLRLLLAIAHTIFSRVDEHGSPAPIRTLDQALERWKNIWVMGRFPETPVQEYLKEWYEHFWLFHPKHPFYQIASDHRGTKFTAAKLDAEVSESSNKVRLFASHSGEGKRSLDYDEAARWLLHLVGFDDTATKPRENKENVKEGEEEQEKEENNEKTASPGTGWLGKLGLVYARGSNLFETMMLNMVLLNEGSCWGSSKPVWENRQENVRQRNLIAVPDNQAELLTVQFRKVHLLRKNGKVVEYRALSGDFFLGDNAFAETMTLWKKGKKQTNMPEKFLPAEHQISRHLWQEFGAMVDQSDSQRQPGIISWIGLLREEGCLPQNFIVHICAAALVYSSTKSSLSDAYSDAVSLHADLLAKAGRPWRTLILEEIAVCGKMEENLKILAENLAKAAGVCVEAPMGKKRLKADKKTVGEAFYSRLDRPFRQWLTRLHAGQSEEERYSQRDQWRLRACRIAKELADEMVDRAGPTAFKGRRVQETRYSAPQAYNQFDKEMKKMYPKKR